MSKRTYLTFVAISDGIGTITGVMDDGNLTDAAGRILLEESGLDVAQGLFDGSILATSIHKAGAAERRNLRKGGNGRADHFRADRIPADSVTRFTDFAIANGSVKGHKAKETKAILGAIRARYGV